MNPPRFGGSWPSDLFPAAVRPRDPRLEGERPIEAGDADVHLRDHARLGLIRYFAPVARAP